MFNCTKIVCFFIKCKRILAMIILKSLKLLFLYKLWKNVRFVNENRLENDEKFNILLHVLSYLFISKIFKFRIY